MSSLPAKFPFSIENILSGSSYKNNSFENGATPRTNVKGPQLTTTEPSFMEILNSKNLSIDYQQNVFGNVPSNIWAFYAHRMNQWLASDAPLKRKGGQVRFLPHQIEVLEQRFSHHKYLSVEERKWMAIQLELSDRQVKTWFQNRRAKCRRMGHSMPNNSLDTDSKTFHRSQTIQIQSKNNE